ncbi:B3 domain-containing protein Os01g0723500 isoform X2 [Manihot esculenta]|uniref:B3 domain-containing protein Os01g0723500 isoform X2 n=1 Tax=Manihot esculenta TaxID=3983 RepID=UPI000B5D50AD|nr:B3 domain-containing protein Os01g0723500 isoform X2 [Manihot esculenta]
MEKQNQAEMVNTSRPCFFEIFSSNLTSDRLRIPVGFTKHMEGRISGLVSLTGPSGNVWHAYLTQQDNDVFLDHGWPTFVKDHLIECGDVLIFRYDGELCFSVQVFDISACEKEAAFHSKCSQDPSQLYKSIGQKREREERAASSDKNCEYVLKKVRGDSSELYSEHINKSLGAGLVISNKEGCQLEEVNTTKKCPEESSSHEKCYSPCPISVIPPQSKPCYQSSEADVQKRIGKEDDLPDRGCGSVLLQREKRVAQSFISCFPYFVRIMKRFNVSGSYTLNIPYQFSTAHLPNCKTEIVLRTVKGACWSVNSVPTTRVHTSHTFCGGWMAFVRSNDIKIGDVCIFELVRKCELRVFILRVGKEVLEKQSGEVASNEATVGCTATAHKSDIFPKKSRKNALKVHSRPITKVEMCDKKDSNKSQVASNHARKCSNAIKSSASAMLCSQSRAVNEKLDVAINSGKNLDVSSHDGVGGRVMLALHEEKAAKSFNSRFPNFVRIMRKFNISGSYTLKIPHQFSAAHLPNCKTEIVLRNSQGICWTVNAVPDSKGRRIHTFCGGWMAFVRDNYINMGDVCIFELAEG